MSVDITAVASKFALRTSPRKRPPPSARVFSPKKSKRRLGESVTVSSEITSEADDTDSLETARNRHKIHASHYDSSCYKLKRKLRG